MKLPAKFFQLKQIALIAACLLTADVFAAGPPHPSALDNSLAIVLLVVAGSLLLIIGMLAYVLLGAGRFHVDRLTSKAKELAPKTAMTMCSVLLSMATFAAGDNPAPAPVSAALSSFSLFMLLTVIGVELIVVFVLLYHVQQLLTKEKSVALTSETVAAETEPFWKRWWNKMNNLRPLHEEKNLAMDHEYDGIIELDNKLPPWWLYGFYLTIIFACIYMYRANVSHTSPSPEQEYAIAMQKADEEKEAYLKHAANKVDENSVTLITDASALTEGKKLFSSMCAPCHGADGQGVVGPNLTDDYWLHRGGVKDIFKSIKYGIPEKGMKSWKDDFSPGQIAALASFIKSINGTKPANAKEPQGDLFKEEATAANDKPLTKN